MSYTTMDIEKVYKEDFSKEYIDELCIDIVNSFIKTHFEEEIIDNLSYEQNVLTIFKSFISENLQENLVYTKDFYKPLASYIFKKNYKQIFQNFADALLTDIVKLSPKVIKFFEYYSQNIIIVDHKKYQVPQIKEIDGPLWNVATISSILTDYMRSKKRMAQIANELQEMEDTKSSYKIDGLTPYEYNEKIDTDIEKIEQEIEKNKERIEMIHDSLIIFEHNQDSTVQSREELEKTKNERQQLKEKKSEILKKKIKQLKLAEYETLLAKIEAIKREYKQEYLIIKRKEPIYIGIRNALIVALTSKKKSL